MLQSYPVDDATRLLSPILCAETWVCLKNFVFDSRKIFLSKWLMSVFKLDELINHL